MINYFFASPRISITARFILLGLLVFGLILPVGAQAFQLPDLTPTPTGAASPTPASTDTALPPLAPVTEEYSWRSIPADASQLASDRSLTILAGKFIFNGLVDASACADGGLLETGAASPCGESAAHNAVIVWQNQFDAEIYSVAREYNIPPFILKNVFIKESQFWPQTYKNPTYGGEYGLGHVTLMGADTLLSWNRAFYKKLCNQNFNQETCRKEYVFQDAGIKAGLQGVVLSSMDADCATCFGRVDLQKARDSISITAATLIANKNYVEWLVNGFSSSSQLTLINTWRFTLASYNAGPGCFTQAFYGTRGNGSPLSWKDVSQRLNYADCKVAIRYVDFIMENVDTADPSALVLASTDPSIAARLVLGPLQTATPEPVLTPAPAILVSETPTVSSLTGTPVSETPIDPSLTVTPLTETPTVSSLTEIPITETPTVSSLTETPAVETPTASSLTEIPIAEVPTEIPATATPAPTETPVPAITATPIAQPTAFVPPSDVAMGEIVVKFGGLVPQFLAESAVGSAGGEIQTQMDALGLTIVSAPQDQIPQVLASLQDNMLVDYAEPNYSVQAFYTPNDPGYVDQTSLADMQIPEAWDVTKGEGIIVAVIDTGVDITHPDLATNILINPGEDGLDANGTDKRTNFIDDDNDGYVDNWMGWNFVDNNNDARDGNGHGTHLAGIIAAQMDNTLGISGIAPHALIMPIKALDNTGFGTYTQVAQAITYAVDHGAKIINLGFGGTANSEALLAATDYAYNHDVIVVAAGGNTGAQTLIYPAANPNVIGVSALDENLNAAAFSSYTNAIQISAPGVGIYSTTPGGNYASMSGTSMSTAQVSGVAALLVTQVQFNTPDAIREAMFNTALDLGDPGLDIHYGYGLVHAFDALNYIPGSITIPTPTASPTIDPNATPIATDVPIDPGGVSIMTDMTASTIATYATSCGTGSNPNYGPVVNYTAALGGTIPTGNNLQANDQITNNPVPIGFDFWYMGTKYTQVIASSNGWLSFSNPGGSYNANDLDNASGSGSASARPLLAPLWDDLGGGGGGSVASYASTGTAPNRTFTFEWWNFQWNNGTASRVSFRVVLHETTGDIDFLYFQNNANGGTSASIGITGTANNSFLSAQNSGACPTWNSAAETANLNTKPPSNTRYTFSPTQVTLAAPSNVNMTNITAATFTINWNDNSTGEDGFGIYTSTDGVNYTYVTQAAANATSVAVTGNAANYWRVYAAVEGNASPAANVSVPTALTFTGVSPSSMTLNWTDNSNNETGFYIFRSTDNANFAQVAKTPANATSYNAVGLIPSTTYYWRVQAVGSATTESTLTASLAGTQATTAVTSTDLSGSTISTYTRSCTTSGYTALAGGTNVAAIQVDDAISGPIQLNSNTGTPFEFWYMGTKYTQVYVSSNGWLSFGNPGGFYNLNDLDNLGGNNGSARPLLAPLWDNMSGIGGTASYRTQGTAPNRTFTIEWLNWRWGNGAGGAVMSFQVVLYEATGVIEFNYRQDGTGINNGSASIGITGSANNSFLSASNVGACPPTWSNVAETANLNTKPVNGARYTFNPNSTAPVAPSGLNLTGVTNTAVTLNWTDNSNNEDGFGIYASTDGVNYYYFGQVPANTTSFNASGLSNSALYYWKVYAAVEGIASAAANASAPSALIFTGVTQTGMTLNWTDNSNNETGFYIFKSTDGVTFGNPIVKAPVGSTSYPVSGLTMGTTYYWRVQAVADAAAETTMSAAASGSQSTLPNTAPVVTINPPANNSYYVQGAPITFTATALDAESGDVSPSLQWTSNIDGAIGLGGTFTKSNLSFGAHTILASATDANGGAGTATVTVTVTSASGNLPPTLSIISPADLTSYALGANITFTGTCLDGAGNPNPPYNNTGLGNISSAIAWTYDANVSMGTGASVSITTLTTGMHTIKATCSDGELTVTRTIRVVVASASGNYPPVVTIIYPANGASFTRNSIIGFVGSASILQNGDISSYITWTDGAGGPTIGTGSSFGLSSLTAGTHTIVASVTNTNNGLSSSDSITITITSSPAAGISPHGSFNGTTEGCALCHRDHSADSWGALVEYPVSPYASNDFCISCHSSGATAVSTHSNIDAVAIEQPFELLCIQCHDPHGNSPNLSAIRKNVRIGAMPTTFDAMTVGLTPIVFTAKTGNGSFDDGTSPAASRVCVACHQDPANPGAPMSIHSGGVSHSGGITYAGQDCTSCHKHSLDSNSATKDGFTTSCRACHSAPQDAGQSTPRRQIVGYPNGSGGNNNDFARASHHVAGNDTATDADCKACHEMTQHRQGKVRLFNQDTPATVYVLDYLKNAADDPADYEAFCLSCHDSNGKAGNTTPFSDKKLIPKIDTSIWSASQHNVLKTGFSASCLDCHSNGHGSNKSHMQSAFITPSDWAKTVLSVNDLLDQEENFCFKCHQTGSTTGIPVQAAFTTYTNTNNTGGTTGAITRFLKHDVSGTYNKHDSHEVFSSLFGSTNRHVECDDCHGPHDDKTGVSIAPAIRPENIGASGVEPVYSGIGVPTSYNFLNQITSEYQFCLKCHSGYTTLPSYRPDGWGGTNTTFNFVADGLRKLDITANGQIQDYRDLAREFNPSAASFHPVMAVGKNTTLPANTWAAGATCGGVPCSAASRVYCTDCHTNATPVTGNNGPHGSPRLHILDGTANYVTVDNGNDIVHDTGELCFKCHSYATYNDGTNDTKFGEHNRHNFASCYDCHDSHGNDVNPHLINFNVSDTTHISFPVAGHTDSQSALAHNNATDGGTCYIRCHNKVHNGTNYP